VRVLCVGNLYPPHDLRGGYEITWRSSVLHLRSRGHVVRVLTSDYHSPDIDPHAELDSDVHRELQWYWREHEFPRYSLRRRIALERHNAAVMDRHLHHLRPDAVAWWGMGGMSLGLIERVRRREIPAVGVVGDEWLRWGPRADGWLRPLRRRPLGAIAECVTRLPAKVDLDDAATWLFNSDAVRQNAISAGLRVPRTQVARPGIDTGLFQAAEPAPWSWRLLYVGRLDPRKGIHVALEALRSLPADATLVIQGSGEPAYERELRDLAQRVGADERVRFSTTPRNDLPEVYANADVVLFPVQWEEPWGLVPLEAMAMGRPVIVTGTGGSREYLRHERNCLLFQPRDSPEALAAAVRRLADSPQLRAQLRAGGLRTAPRYTEDAYNETIETTLRLAVSGRGRPRPIAHEPAGK
jgi:glycosyltransferase involved in cell wall biosynthesis